MGIFSRRARAIDAINAAMRPTLPTMPSTPFDSQDSLQTALISDLFGLQSDVITREIALRVGPLKRAVQIHADTVSTMQLCKYVDGVKVPDQPRWLTNSNSGVAPLIRTKGLVKDLALEGWALLGCETDNGQIVDAIHIPKRSWKFNDAGVVEFTELVDPRYTGHLILIPLGDNGILIDAVDTIRQARALDVARRIRLESPPAGTELHINDPSYDEMTKKEQLKEIRAFIEQAKTSSVRMTKSFVELKEHGDKAVDLFDSATNSIRLDIANHASLPASAIEGAVQSGGSEMHYIGVGGDRSQIYDLGSRQFADAIAARLSLDDVCEPGSYIAFDRSDAFANPTPTNPPRLED